MLNWWTYGTPVFTISMLYTISILNIILLETYVIGNQKHFRNLKNRCAVLLSSLNIRIDTKITDYQNNDWQCSDYFMRYYFKYFTFISSLNPHNFIKSTYYYFPRYKKKCFQLFSMKRWNLGSKPQTLCSWFLHFKGFWQHWKNSLSHKFKTFDWYYWLYNNMIIVYD